MNNAVKNSGRIGATSTIWGGGALDKIFPRFHVLGHGLEVFLGFMFLDPAPTLYD